MSIRFKVIQRGQPGVVGGGVKKYYAIPSLNGEMTLAELTKAIEKLCTVTGADIRAVLYALVDVAIDRLSNGTIVRLGELGSLRMSFNAEGKSSWDLVNAATIKKANVIFTPGPRVKEMLANVKFEKEN